MPVGEKEISVSTLREVDCDECGNSGQDPIQDLCGEWLGTPENGYICSDIICLNCRMEEMMSRMEESEEEVDAD